MALYEYFTIVVLLIAFVTDLRTSKIPNWLIVISLILGLLYHGLNGMDGVLFAGAGFLAGILPTMFLYVFKALGAGDVKLFAALGAIGGASFVLTLLIYAVIFSGIIGLIVVGLRFMKIKRFTTWGQKIPGVHHTESQSGKKQLRFPFMYAVLPAAVITFTLGTIAL
ncbi:A24 family peptidase [Aureibacillus halotolerans]|uniref:Prepilin peptidase CpaA n=1 Tax=Aureibacillus halotolerans TaxID=1508390 RepID=A0A4R6U789_9BACI|nr:A24 family peptidase [Aureibacillus halotolerans]TDQ42201.1 prepilin peptidase CpaA [Aureibacillus halotolerans]